MGPGLAKVTWETRGSPLSSCSLSCSPPPAPFPTFARAGEAASIPGALSLAGASACHALRAWQDSCGLWAGFQIWSADDNNSSQHLVSALCAPGTLCISYFCPQQCAHFIDEESKARGEKVTWPRSSSQRVESQDLSELRCTILDMSLTSQGHRHSHAHPSLLCAGVRSPKWRQLPGSISQVGRILLTERQKDLMCEYVQS